jgi:methionyl-tRNA formyltransferase
VKIIFFGTPFFAVPTLEALYAMAGVEVAAVVTQPDKPSGRGAKILPTPVKEVASQHGTPLFQPRSLRKEFASIHDSLSARGPFDIGIVIAFGQILPREVLELPRCGCLNIHASLLPRWRGAAPIQRAIQAGDDETGVCLMRMEEGLDTGPVFSCERTSISLAETGSSLHDRLALLGAQLLIRDLRSIVDGEMHAAAQPDEGVTYASKITADDCRIDWSSPAPSIARAIRAFSPHPGCFSFLRDKRLKVLSGRAVSASHSTPLGTIISVSAERLEVSCGEGLLRIDELQLEGKKRMTSEEFLRGIALSPGERLISAT